MDVSEILRSKGTKVITVKPDERLTTLAHRLRHEKIGAAVVSADGNSIDGIISERDIAHGLASHGAHLAELHVSDLMTKSVISCKPGDSISDISRIMTNRRIRHLPVKEGARLVGIVSVGDVVKYRLDELQMEANVMRDYAIARV
jgi:CBS domain-containing protein